MRRVLFAGALIDVVSYIFQYFRSDKLRGIRHLGTLKILSANTPVIPIFPAEYWRSSIMSSMVALEATEPGKAHQSQLDLAYNLPLSDGFRDCCPDDRFACRNRVWSPHDPVFRSGLLRFHCMEGQTDVVRQGDVQRHDFPAEATGRGGEDEDCATLRGHIGDS